MDQNYYMQQLHKLQPSLSVSNVPASSPRVHFSLHPTENKDTGSTTAQNQPKSSIKIQLESHGNKTTKNNINSSINNYNSSNNNTNNGMQEGAKIVRFAGNTQGS